LWYFGHDMTSGDLPMVTHKIVAGGNKKTAYLKVCPYHGLKNSSP
jgi:hypothetical protein